MVIDRVKHAAGAVLIAALLPTGMAHADTLIVSDGFDDGARTDGADALDIAWYEGRTNVAISVGTDDGAGGIGDGNALLVNSSTTFSRIGGVVGSDVTIGVGETLQLTFDMRFTQDPSSNSAGLRVGLFNDGGTPLTGDNAGTQTDDFGYGFRTNPASASATGTNVATEDVGNSFLGGSNPGGFNVTGDAGASISWGQTTHSVLFSITRLANGTLDLSASIDGGVAATGNVAAFYNNYTFNMIGIGQGSINNDYNVDNVQLTLVPEPSSLALLALGGLFVARRRRSA